MKAISILVADDHPVVRRGIRALLEPNVGWEIIAELSNGRDAVTKARERKPDIAILDIRMPLLNGLEAARQIVKYSPSTRVLILSMYDSEEFIQKAVTSGAKGFVRKSEAEEELVAAIRALLADKLFFPSGVLRMLRQERHANVSTPHSSLTQRETELLQLIAEGHSNKRAASILGISHRTVENHRARIMRKLGLRSATELVRYAIRHKIVAA